MALALAERLRQDGENPVAVSADALQVYRGLETLTGAASAEQRAQLEHRLLGFVPITATFSAGEYMALAHAEIDRAIGAGRRPLVVGGTGLYLQAALCDLDLRPPPARDLRARIASELSDLGPEAMHARLMQAVPEAAAGIDPSDRSRLVRALELVEMGEEPPARGERSRLWTAELRHPTLLCGLVMERGALYERTDARVEALVASGAVDEVRRADDAGASITARKALGFEELLAGDVHAMRRRTRNYAKRQLTWMRKLAPELTIDVTEREPADVAEEIAKPL